MWLKNINKVIIIFAFALSAMIITAGLTLAEDPPSLDLGNIFDDEEDAPPSLDIPADEDTTCDEGYHLSGGECVRDSTQGNQNGSSGGTTPEKQCGDNRDNDNDGKKDFPADPGCTSRSDNSEIDPPTGNLRIDQATVFPVGFNPTMTGTKISYKLSGNGFVELTILDNSGVNIVKLIDNEEVDGNELLEVSWDGTNRASGGGTVVSPGKYFFKLTAKPSAEAEASDTKTGEISVIYATPDIEDRTGSGNNTGSRTIASINNHNPGETTGTGPETLIYLIFPVIGYFIAKK